MLPYKLSLIFSQNVRNFFKIASKLETSHCLNKAMGFHSLCKCYNDVGFPRNVYSKRMATQMPYIQNLRIKSLETAETCKHYRSYDTLASTSNKSKITNISCQELEPSQSFSSSISGSSDNITHVRNLITKLTDKERKEILIDLQFQDAEEIKQKAEDKLASYRWRSRFGRPSSVPHPTSVDPTGTYCEIPDDWLQKKIAEKKPVKPTSSELQQIGVFNALPFIGFGCLDNVIMIVAGDYIDTSIGTYLGISTMAAAALGNTISDLAGIGSAWYVEVVAAKIGVKHPDLSQEQLDMPSSRWSANIGRSLGVVLGCIIGMFPLMFLPDHTKEKEAKNENKAEVRTPSK